MKLLKVLPPAFAAAAMLTPAASLADTSTVDPGKLIATDQTVELQSNTTRDIVVPIRGLGTDHNVLVPCYGFEIAGPGVDLAGANLEFFGAATPENPDLPDGGIIGAQRDAAGNFIVPETAAVLTSEVLRMGANCRSAGWGFYDADGRQALDTHDNPKAALAPANASKAKAASKRKRDKASKRFAKQIVSRAAKDGPVTVSVAGITPQAGRTTALVLRVTTGELAGTTTVSLHARVLRQG